MAANREVANSKTLVASHIVTSVIGNEDVEGCDMMDAERGQVGFNYSRITCYIEMTNQLVVLSTAQCGCGCMLTPVTLPPSTCLLFFQSCLVLAATVADKSELGELHSIDDRPSGLHRPLAFGRPIVVICE